ncbi:MAG: LytR C-terminal domain-containing protein [Gemmatimonadota bacterium]|nr:LytR C-terminal domain-containing protein [Gemmatimonadota bacterium]
MNRRAVALAASALVCALVVVAGISYGRVRAAGESPQRAMAPPPPSSPRIPHLEEPEWATGHRITVEVLNATKVRGLARRAALTLRDKGFDVVSTGTNRDQFDSTKVLDRTGHRDWAVLAAKAMGGGAVLVRPDSSREVDLTVLIGASWRAPSEPFYP